MELHETRGPAAEGQTVATLVSVAGVWFLNPCRVVYTARPAEARRAAFAYGTLEGHIESGEERFEVSLDPESGRVYYGVTAFSRPALLMSRFAYPLVRKYQKRFAHSSAAALGAAV